MLSISSSLLTILVPFIFLLILNCSAFSGSCSPVLAPSSGPGVGGFFGDLRKIKVSCGTTFCAPAKLKIVVFNRKWPVASALGGMRRHAHTLHTALAARGHSMHVFTFPLPYTEAGPSPSPNGPELHFLDGEPGQWRCDQAWKLYEVTTHEAKGENDPFDVIYSESMAVFHQYARSVDKLEVSWRDISLEALHSGRSEDDTLSPSFNQSPGQSVYHVLSEVHFFRTYQHQVGTPRAPTSCSRVGPASQH